MYALSFLLHQCPISVEMASVHALLLPHQILFLVTAVPRDFTLALYMVLVFLSYVALSMSVRSSRVLFLHQRCSYAFP